MRKIFVLFLLLFLCSDVKAFLEVKAGYKTIEELEADIDEDILTSGEGSTASAVNVYDNDGLLGLVNALDFDESINVTKTVSEAVISVNADYISLNDLADYTEGSLDNDYHLTIYQNPGGQTYPVKINDTGADVFLESQAVVGLVLEIQDDAVDDSDINFGTNTNQVSTDDVPEGTSNYFVQDNDNVLMSSIVWSVDNSGTAIEVSTTRVISIPFDCTITKCTILTDQSGSITIDIRKDTYANYPPTIEDSIVASSIPTISTAIKSQDTTLSGWTTDISSGDVLLFVVKSALTINRFSIILDVEKDI